MRQRLLLTAGWIVAAVGSGLVASAAVGVAGGQVSDRPLRPLTAAEVAALPVERSVDVAEPIEPLASGGSESTSGNPTGRDEGTTTASAVGPAGAGGAPAAPVPSSPSSSADASSDDPVSTDDPTAPPLGLRTEASVVQLPGGTASVGAAAGQVALLWATPRPGFVVELRFESTDRLTLTFTGPTIRHVLDASTEAGRLLITTSEERFR